MRGLLLLIKDYCCSCRLQLLNYFLLLYAVVFWKVRGKQICAAVDSGTALGIGLPVYSIPAPKARGYPKHHSPLRPMMT